MPNGGVSAAVGRASDLHIRPYGPDDDAEARSLERDSPQGKSFRLRFERPYFHRRAENFERWHLVAARLENRLVGVAGAALKDVVWNGRATRALYLFDVRVAPDRRRSGIAQSLIDSLVEWGKGEAEIGYGYVAGDNRESLELATRAIGAAAEPAFAVLALPTARGGGHEIPSADPAAVHSSYCAKNPQFDLYCDPSAAFNSSAFIGSWRLGNGTAGCSAWSNAAIFAEVVEAMPAPLSALSALSRRWPANHFLPALPRPGERIHSWYLFDFHASAGESARALFDGVADAARVRGVDYCYIIHHGSPNWLNALRRRVPRVIAPVVPWSIVARSIDERPVKIKRPYVDIRDV